MGTDDDAEQQAQAAIDQLMQSASAREARDVVRAAPYLTDPYFSQELGRMAKALRQRGEVQTAVSVEHWQSVLQRFRELGIQQGYLEYVIDGLVGARSQEEHARIVADNPDFRAQASVDYFKQRGAEAQTRGDQYGMDRYRMAIVMAIVPIAGGQAAAPLDIDGAVNDFLGDFVYESDPAVNLRVLQRRPELLMPPLNVLVGGFLDRAIEEAQASNDLVTLRPLIRRQGLFRRCQEVGVDQAFDEYARGVSWPSPSRS
jgi:hypothetical protein